MADVTSSAADTGRSERPSTAGQRVLGAVLAGGASSRFGAPKGLALLGGRTLVARVISSLRAVGVPVVLIANDPAVADQWDPSMPDREPGCGPLGGIPTALGFAAGEGMNGALCVACDMPLVSPGLLRLILAEADRSPARIVVPESNGRRGFEPLCAYYPVEVLSEAETARAPHELVERFSARLLPLDEVRRLGTPEILFFNVNTPDDLARAERIARVR